MLKKPLVLAYFLPQFHSCEYNNKWWGEGFTEWNNVRVAEPYSSDHRQPRIPLDGYYDLLDSNTLENQYRAASSAGLDGFAFYHYWYNDDRPLGAVLDRIIANPKLDIKYSLCWANHSWTRSWKNRSGALDTLIEQTYGSTVNERQLHFKYLEKCFLDSRYVKVEGKPFFQIYIPEAIPHLEVYLAELRSYFIENHEMEIHLSATIRQKSISLSYLDVFDSVTLNQPTLAFFSDEHILQANKIGKFNFKFIREVSLQIPLGLRKYLFRIWDLLPSKLTFFDYDETWLLLLEQSKNAAEESVLPVNFAAFVDFDNTPRYKDRAKITTGFDPKKFGIYFGKLYELSLATEADILFINAWNEWGEGMYLQADSHFQSDRLDILSDILSKRNS